MSENGSDMEKAVSFSQRKWPRRLLGNPPPGHDPGPPPDGGLEAWTQAVLGHLCAFTTWGLLNSYGAFQTYYTNDLLTSESASSISWIGSFQLFLIFFVGALSGRALDAGFFRPVFVAGNIFLLLGVFMTSLAKTYWQVFLAQGLCAGIGGGLMFTPALGLVATYFQKRRTLVMAIFLTGSGVGGMVFPAIVSQLLSKIGFGWTIRIVGFVMLSVSIVMIIFFKPRLQPRTTGPLVEWSAFKEAPFVLFITGMWFNFFSLYFAFYYIGSFGRDVIGLSYQSSVNLIITVNGLGIPGRVIPAFFSDKYTGPLNLIIPLGCSAAVLAYCWAAVHSTGGVYAFAIFYGIFANAMQGLWPGGLASLTGDISKIGTRMGMGFTIVSTALLTGPPVGGALIARDDGNYFFSQMWAGSSLIIGSILVTVARISKTGMKLKVKV